MIRRLLTACAAGLLGALAVGAPAFAHGADAPDGTDYRTEVTGLAPALPGVTVRAIEAGARLELTNRTGRTIEVLGYDGEPYLEVRPDGTYENRNSPTTYVNQTLDADSAVPATADSTLPPDWRRIDTEPVVRWHDRRTHWVEQGRPPQVVADPDRTHRVRDWVVPMRDGVTPMELRGTLDWVPPPNPGSWWLATVVGALLLGTLGVLPADRRPGRTVTAVLAGGFALAGLGAVTLAVARELDAGAVGVGGVLTGLLAGQIWPVLTGLGAVTAGAYALARRPAADFALALSGACLALFAGVANAAVFGRSVAPVPWPAVSARLLVAVVIVVGVGGALAGVLRLRAAPQEVAPDPASEGDGQARAAAAATGSNP
ncbi:hypothetical protein ACI2K4_06530 [Micromonospora sp. NPDC050397]|uniref:hypothetical protein n=1 Tax=Micromonospora sp. NPDC050397 TaxID=3364279 RepID=UPI0038516648